MVEQSEFAEHRKREELLELVFAHVADAVFVLTPEGGIINVNPAACVMMGYSKEELLGMRLWDFVSGTSRKKILEPIDRLNRRVLGTIEHAYRRKTGEQSTMDLRLARIGCAGGDLRVASGHDVTEQKLLEKLLHDLNERQLIEEEPRRLNVELLQPSLSSIVRPNAGGRGTGVYTERPRGTAGLRFPVLRGLPICLQIRPKA